MLRTKLSSIRYWLGVVALGTALGLGLQFAQAWTNPTEAPPGGNVAGPLTTSAFAQYKSGALGVGGLLKAYLGLDANAQRITNVAAPVNGTDAVNKDYVDAAGGGGKYSKTCKDWSGKGWVSQDDCLFDGRWHMVYKHDSNGNATSEGLFTSHSAFAGFMKGSPVETKVRNGSDGGYISCAIVYFPGDGTVICGEPLRWSASQVDQWSDTRYGTPGSCAFISNGKVQCHSFLNSLRSYGSQFDGLSIYNPHGATSSLHGDPYNRIGEWYVRF